MGGLEKITGHILDNAKTEADEIIKKAKAQAEEIKVNATEKREERKKTEQERITAECEAIINMNNSNDRQEKREILLESKNKLIEEIIAEAKENIKNADKSEYLLILKTLLKKSISDKKGEIIFSKRDKAFVDADFIAECEDISGGLLKVSDEVTNADGGFIIRYGKMEINCTIDSLFEDKYSELTDLVNSCIKA